MIDKSLADYIVAKKQAGASDETIRRELLTNKWSPIIIDEALGIPVPKESHLETPTPTSTHILSVGELFSVSFKMFKERFWNIVLVMLVPGSLGFLSAILVGVLSVLAKQSSALAVVIIGCIVLFIPFIIVEIWGTVAMMTAICSKEKKSVKEVYKSSWKNIMSFFYINFLIGCIVLGGSILLIVPAIIFSVWFLFSNYVLIVDEVKGFAALMRSREYVRGHWWMVMGRLILVSLTAGLAMIIVGIPLSLMGFDSESIPFTLISGIVSSVFGVYSMCYMFQLFNNLRDVKGKFETVVTTKSKVIYIIISIIGLLGIVAIPLFAILTAINPKEQIQKAQLSVQRNDKAEISLAIMKYYATKGVYPISLDVLVPEELASIPTGSDKNSCYTATIAKSDLSVVVNYDKKTDVVCNSITIVNTPINETVDFIE